MAAVNHDGSSLLLRSSRGSAGPLWQTRHIQNRPGIAVHINRLHGGPDESRDCNLSMDGKGAWQENVFVEQLWRSIKYTEVCLHAYRTVSEACAGIGRYLILP